MNTEHILIKISDAPGHLPAGYTDEIYIEGRVRRIGSYEEKLITQERFNAIFDDKNEQRLVQAIVYNKYELELIKRENSNIDLLQYAETVKIYSYDDNSEHHARILNFSIKPVPGSAFQQITIEYFDKFSYNYHNGSNIVNMLRSDSLISRYTAGELNHVQVYLSAYVSYNFYSPFESEKFIENENIIENELNGKMINTRITQKTKRRLTIYLNEQDAYELSYYGGLANDYTYKLYFIASANYRALERPTIEVTKEPLGVDLYKVIITMTTAINNKHIYA